MRRMLFIIAVASVSIHLASIFLAFGYTSVPSGLLVGVEQGALHLGYGDFGWQGTRYWSAVTYPPQHIEWLPSLGEQGRGWIDTYPLWCFSAPALAAALAVRTKRRAALTCHDCGYDLRGNTTSVCPECGDCAQARQHRRVSWWWSFSFTTLNFLVAGICLWPQFGRTLYKGVKEVRVATSFLVLALGILGLLDCIMPRGRRLGAILVRSSPERSSLRACTRREALVRRTGLVVFFVLLGISLRVLSLSWAYDGDVLLTRPGLPLVAYCAGTATIIMALPVMFGVWRKNLALAGTTVITPMALAVFVAGYCLDATNITGCAITAACGMALGTVYASCVLHDEVSTHPPGHCTRCGYRLIPQNQGRCPECGNHRVVDR